MCLHNWYSPVYKLKASFGIIGFMKLNIENALNIFAFSSTNFGVLALCNQPLVIVKTGLAVCLAELKHQNLSYHS